MKTALVTGGGVRIGRALALALASDGYDVVVHYCRNGGPAAEVFGLIEGLRRRAWAVAADFGEPGAAKRLFAAALEVAGMVDVVVNNAAIFTKGVLSEATEDDFVQVWRVNVMAPVMLTKALAAHVIGRGATAEGCAVNLLDCRINGDCSDCLAYGASKRALAGFTRDAALGLAPQVRVNAIAPGPVLPPPTGAPREAAGSVPLQARPTPEEIATALLFLIKAKTVTGQTIFVDGGQGLVR